MNVLGSFPSPYFSQIILVFFITNYQIQAKIPVDILILRLHSWLLPQINRKPGFGVEKLLSNNSSAIFLFSLLRLSDPAPLFHSSITPTPPPLPPPHLLSPSLHSLPFLSHMWKALYPVWWRGRANIPG